MLKFNVKTFKLMLSDTRKFAKNVDDMIGKFDSLIENQQKDIDSSIKFISENLNKLDTTSIELEEDRPIGLADVLNNNLR